MKKSLLYLAGVTMLTACIASCKKNATDDDYLKESDRRSIKIYTDEHFSKEDLVSLAVNVTKQKGAEETPLEINSNIKSPSSSLIIRTQDLLHRDKSNPVILNVPYKNVTYMMCMDAQSNKTVGKGVVYMEYYDTEEGVHKVGTLTITGDRIATTMVLDQ